MIRRDVKTALAALVVVILAALVWFAGRRRSCETAPVDDAQSAPVASQEVRTEIADTTSPVANRLIRPDSLSAISGKLLARDDEDVGTNICTAVRTIVGSGRESLGYSRRTRAFNDLPASLTDDEIATLVRFLDEKTEGALRPIELNALKNDVLDLLLQQNQIPDGLGDRMVEMFRDPEHNDIWRDYCIQYFATYYDIKRRSVEQSTGDDECSRIVSAYWEAVEGRHGTFPGTALIGMEQLSKTWPEIDRDAVASAAAELAAQEGISEPSRITALRIAGAMGAAGALAAARDAARDGDTEVLKMAGIATLGDLGDETDLEILGTMAESGQKRLAVAATTALENLNKRLLLEESGPSDSH